MNIKYPNEDRHAFEKRRDSMLLQRNKRFDDIANNLAYHNELITTRDLLIEFADKLTQQTVVLAFGGNRTMLELFNFDEYQDILANEILQKENVDDFVFDLYLLHDKIMKMLEYRWLFYFV
jgi:hypothetical protein